MATHAQIAVLNEDGSVTAIYQHFDGYPEYTLPILKENYKTLELAKLLVSFGDMSVLSANVEPTGPHSFEHPELGVCIYYGRDRGEVDVEAQHYANIDMWRITGNKQSYNYIFKDGEWSIV